MNKRFLNLISRIPRVLPLANTRFSVQFLRPSLEFPLISKTVSFGQTYSTVAAAAATKTHVEVKTKVSKSKNKSVRTKKVSKDKKKSVKVESAKVTPAKAMPVQAIPVKVKSVKVKSVKVKSTKVQSAKEESEPKARKRTRKVVGYWFLASGSLVFAIVVLGGLTRLTESGLSIVEWNLINGALPPMSQDEWDMEFQKYQGSPEYKLLNQNMTLSEFKTIYYMEWAHRNLGRFIGIFFVLPGAYYALRGYMNRTTLRNTFVISCLIGCQGLLGWLMVRSGLDDKLMEIPHAVPRVSHYWLAAHLGSAFVIYSAMLWNAFRILRIPKHVIPWFVKEIANLLVSWENE